jgi:hypothetical protein
MANDDDSAQPPASDAQAEAHARACAAKTFALVPSGCEDPHADARRRFRHALAENALLKPLVAKLGSIGCDDPHTLSAFCGLRLLDKACPSSTLRGFASGLDPAADPDLGLTRLALALGVARKQLDTPDDRDELGSGGEAGRRLRQRLAATVYSNAKEHLNAESMALSQLTAESVAKVWARLDLGQVAEELLYLERLPLRTATAGAKVLKLSVGATVTVSDVDGAPELGKNERSHAELLRRALVVARTLVGAGARAIECPTGRRPGCNSFGAYRVKTRDGTEAAWHLDPLVGMRYFDDMLTLAGQTGPGELAGAHTRYMRGVNDYMVRSNCCIGTAMTGLLERGLHTFVLGPASGSPSSVDATAGQATAKLQRRITELSNQVKTLRKRKLKQPRQDDAKRFAKACPGGSACDWHARTGKHCRYDHPAGFDTKKSRVGGSAS